MYFLKAGITLPFTPCPQILLLLSEVCSEIGVVYFGKEKNVRRYFNCHHHILRESDNFVYTRANDSSAWKELMKILCVQMRIRLFSSSI